MRAYLALTLLILSSLACMQQVATPTVTPNVTDTTTGTVAPTQERSTSTPTPLPAVTVNQQATILQAVVNVRTSPDGDVIGYVVAGDTVTVLACSGDWCQIESPAGWIWAGCLSVGSEKGCAAK